MNKRYFIMSDPHGDWRVFRDFVKEHSIDNTTENYMIILGDMGFNYFFGLRDIIYKNQVCKYPITYFCIRGNHEERPSVCMKKEPENWHTEEFFGNTVYVENEWSQIKYALDGGGEYVIEGKNVLVLPGAYSVDKQIRLLRGWSWFEGEQLTNQEKSNIEDNLKPHYDFIFSHTCPYSWEEYIRYLFFEGVDQNKLDKSMEKWMDRLLEKTNYTDWFFGHYHDDLEIPQENATMVFHKGFELFLGD